MKYFPLMWAGLARKPVRTLLMTLSLIVGFQLFGILHGVDRAFDVALSRMRMDRLIVESRFSEPPLPVSYAEQIRQVPRVTDVAWTVFMQTAWQDPKNTALIVAAEPESFLRIRDEFETGPGALEALTRTRTGVIVVESLARKYGWKVGDRVALQAPGSRRDGSGDWALDIVGLMNNPSNPGQLGFGLVRYDYFDDVRRTGTGTVGRYVVKIGDPTRAVEIGRSIDRVFENSSAPTRTKTENESARTQLAIIGDVSVFTRGIIGAVFMALLFLTANTVLQSTRERTPEIAVMKVLGFPDGLVMVLVVAETLLICTGAALLGIALAGAFFPQAGEYIPGMSAYLPPTPMSSTVYVSGLAVAVGLALLSAAVPAFRAMRIRIVDALAAH
jgi:putative ABC transport system permease protein